MRSTYIQQTKKTEAAYGNIDEQAPEDPYYNNTFRKIGKGTAIGGGALAATGAAYAGIQKKKGAKKGYEALAKIAEEQEGIRSSEFFSKDHFGHAGDGSFFDKQLKEERARHAKKIAEHKQNIESLAKTNKKEIIAAGKHSVGKAAAKAAAGLAVLGTGVYVASKLANNSRKTYKKDAKDILVQAGNEINKK